MTSSTDPADRFFGIWRQMRRGPLVRDLKRLFQPESGPSLSGSEIDVIQALASRPSGCGMTELTTLVAADAGNLTRTIAQLVAKDCVRRRTDRIDARERVIELSQLGREIARRQTVLRHALFEAALAHLSLQQRGQLLDNLDRALAAMHDLAAMEAAPVPLAQNGSGVARDPRAGAYAIGDAGGAAWG